MNILLSGGSGDVGTLLTIDFLKRDDRVVNIDMSTPKIAGAEFVQGSILDRTLLTKVMTGIDCVIHIAAWHGVHESSKTPADFHDLNVTGTFNVLQAAVDAHVQKFIFISSTSVDDQYGLYGSSKILGESMMRAYAERNPAMTIMTLRPRAFIPSWNKAVYNNFIEWAAWFMKGAVHINDFKEALLIATDLTPDTIAPIYTIDGAYDYTADDLHNWSNDTFKQRYPEFVNLATKHNIDTTRKPKILDIPEAQKLPGYKPRYSLRNMLEELRDFGIDGPMAPFKI